MLCLFLTLPYVCTSLPLVENPSLIVPGSSLMQGCSFVEEDEVRAVERLIETTQQQLKTQETLKNLMLCFQKERESFAQGNHTKAQAGRLVKAARQIQGLIQDNHFEHLFSKNYLDELQFFSSIAGKQSISRGP